VPALRIATRGSRLARWQADRVAELLAAHGVETELVIVSTTGDERTEVPIHAMGGTGVFVHEIQSAVLSGRADIAVHSAKDLPAGTPEGLLLASVPERADVRDALVGARLADLRPGSVVATGSVRRRVQLAAAVAGLEFAELRGNIETRLAKAQHHTAIVVAYAALVRLGLADRATEVLATAVMLPQVAQGALGVECRVDDSVALAALRAIDDNGAHACVNAERAFLAGIGGGCDQPLGALAIRGDDGVITLEAMLADDAGTLHHATARGDASEALGADVARQLASVVHRSGPQATRSGDAPA
jgi:hydroxymethylbilane synthase